MNSQVLATIDAALRERQLLTHPFYRRWQAGQLRREELTNYAEQYRYFETMLPAFLLRLSAALPVGDARDLVLANYSDEVASPSHLELFEQFANFFHASNPPISPAMQQLTDGYFEVLERSPEAALAGLLAYESQGAAIADSKAEGLQSFYEAPSEALEFWNVHGSVEDDHARWTLEAFSSMDPDLDEALYGAQLISDAWWMFLDECEALSV